MMKRMATVFLGISLILSGCGGSGDKNLFSSWSSVPSGSVLDMSNANFGTISVTWTLQSGAHCASIMVIGGTQSSGTAIISGTIGGAGCSALDGSYTYTKTSNQLTVCQGSSCTDYQ